MESLAIYLRIYHKTFNFIDFNYKCKESPTAQKISFEIWIFKYLIPKINYISVQL
jgi:hypothetical protein